MSLFPTIAFSLGTNELAKRWQSYSFGSSKIAKDPVRSAQDLMDRNLCIQNLFSLAVPTMPGLIGEGLQRAIPPSANTTEALVGLIHTVKNLALTIGFVAVKAVALQQMQANRYAKPVALVMSGIVLGSLGHKAYTRLVKEESKDRTWEEFTETALIQGFNLSVAAYKTASLVEMCRSEFFPTITDKMQTIVSLENLDEKARACTIYAPACSKGQVNLKTVKDIYRQKIAKMHPDKHLGKHSELAKQAFSIASSAKDFLLGEQSEKSGSESIEQSFKAFLGRYTWNDWISPSEGNRQCIQAQRAKIALDQCIAKSPVLPEEEILEESCGDERSLWDLGQSIINGYKITCFDKSSTSGTRGSSWR